MGKGISNLGPSDEEAETLGATVISNSWNNGFEGSGEKEIHEAEEKERNKYFDHEKVPILFSGGDYGYSVRYPAVSQYVIAVGGTNLKKTSEGSRKWTEEVWSNTEYGYREKGRGTGSGCSKYEPKPKWQADKACTHRIQNDVAAVAAPESPVSIYDTYKGGWANSGGTSASSPFVAGVEGLSTSHSRSLKADAFYVGKGSLFDVTKGSNGTCTPPTEDEYFCTAAVGYDGPTGNGAPDGALALTGAPIAITGVATNIVAEGATLNGTVNPEGKETKYDFEYGLEKEKYTNKTAEVSAGSGTSNVEESKAITGFTPETTYHFRIVASNGTETTHGEDHTFTTTPIWSAQELPLPEGTRFTSLEDVSCTSSTTCTAVGVFTDGLLGEGEEVPLAESLSGTTWSVQQPPRPREASAVSDRLEGVSCTSSKACVAVGHYYSKSAKYVALAESWNGTAWSLLEPKIPTEAKGSELYGVSCTSSTACTAVGRFKNSAGVLVPLAESWNGTTWSVQEPPIPAGAKQSELLSVSCSASNACTGVGVLYNSSEKWLLLAERWNGTEWSRQEPPLPTGATKYNGLTGVSCTSAAACTAVGYFGNSAGKEVPLAESWNGTAWSAEQPPVPTGVTTGRTTLRGVSCTSSVACVAVGIFRNSAEHFESLAEIWNGTTWSLQEPPPAPGAKEGSLVTVSCTSSTACTAVAGTVADTYR